MYTYLEFLFFFILISFLFQNCILTKLVENVFIDEEELCMDCKTLDKCSGTMGRCILVRMFEGRLRIEKKQQRSKPGRWQSITIKNNFN